MTRILFRNCILPDETTASILVHDAAIFAIGDLAVPDGADLRVFDMKGMRVFPGGIDPHVHGRDMDEAHKETLETCSKGLLRGGTTAACAIGNTNPLLVVAEAFKRYAKLAAKAAADFKVIFVATGENFDEILAVRAHPMFGGPKIFFDAPSTGNVSIPRESLRPTLQFCKDHGMLPMIHAESNERIASNREALKRQGILAQVSDHCFIRDTESEVAAVEAVLESARKVDVVVYFCHISTPEAVELILRERTERGLYHFIEVCPHHLYFDMSFLGRSKGSLFKMNPALRTANQVHRLVSYVCQSGAIDCIGSDHAPHTLDEKAAAEYDQVPSGIPGGLFRVPLIYNFVRDGKMSVDRFIRLTSTTAADLFGFEKRGRLQRGCFADFYFIDPNAVHEVTGAEGESKVGWTPYERLHVCLPQLTVARGAVYDWR